MSTLSIPDTADTYESVYNIITLKNVNKDSIIGIKICTKLYQKSFEITRSTYHNP